MEGEAKVGVRFTFCLQSVAALGYSPLCDRARLADERYCVALVLSRREHLHTSSAASRVLEWGQESARAPSRGSDDSRNPSYGPENESRARHPATGRQHYTNVDVGVRARCLPHLRCLSSAPRVAL